MLQTVTISTILCSFSDLNCPLAEVAQQKSKLLHTSGKYDYRFSRAALVCLPTGGSSCLALQFVETSDRANSHLCSSSPPPALRASRRNPTKLWGINKSLRFLWEHRGHVLSNLCILQLKLILWRQTLDSTRLFEWIWAKTSSHIHSACLIMPFRLFFC